MSTTLKIYDKIRALAGSWEMYHNGIKWNTVFRNGEIIRGRIEANYSSQYFTLESIDNNNTITFQKGSAQVPDNTFYYSLDNGSTWTSSNTITSWTINSGEKILLKSEANQWSYGIWQVHCWFFSSTARYNVYGNIMSIFYGDNFSSHTSFPPNYDRSLFSLFRESTYLVDASNLLLPATTLTNYCYSCMFKDCTSLVKGPTLLPATTIAEHCYEEMFQGCTSLETVPEQLPATTLASCCYQNMFNGCTSITKAPILPATTLANYCYYAMFRYCSSLSSITCYATDRSATGCTDGWVQGVSSKGNFYKADPLWTSSFIGTNSVYSIPKTWCEYIIGNNYPSYTKVHEIKMTNPQAQNGDNHFLVFDTGVVIPAGQDLEYDINYYFYQTNGDLVFGSLPPANNAPSYYYRMYFKNSRTYVDKYNSSNNTDRIYPVSGANFISLSIPTDGVAAGRFWLSTGGKASSMGVPASGYYPDGSTFNICITSIGIGRCIIWSDSSKKNILFDGFAVLDENNTPCLFNVLDSSFIYMDNKDGYIGAGKLTYTA